MNEPLTFTVIGTPVGQGSKTRTRWGMREDNPETKPWRATVKADAAAAMNGRPLIHEPVEVLARFYYTRPKAHYRTGKHSAELKPTAPYVCATLTDLDKAQRAIGDALTGSVLRDDKQIVHWDAWKLYGEPARCEITVSVLA